MSRFILVTKEIYPLLIQGFHSGSWMLSSDNPDNEKRDRRKGRNGGEIAKGERAILRSLRSLSTEREFTDDELYEWGKTFEKENGHPPSSSDIDKLDKPLELKESPCWWELNEDSWERFKDYFSEVKWNSRFSVLAANILDMIEAAPKDKPTVFDEVINGINS